MTYRLESYDVRAWRGVGRFETAPLLHLATELICRGLIALYGTPLILLSDEDTFPTIQPAFPLLEPCVGCQVCTQQPFGYGAYSGLRLTIGKSLHLISQIGVRAGYQGSDRCQS